MTSVQEQHISGTQVTATRTDRFTEVQTSQNLTVKISPGMGEELTDSHPCLTSPRGW